MGVKVGVGVIVGIGEGVGVLVGVGVGPEALVTQTGLAQACSG